MAAIGREGQPVAIMAAPGDFGRLPPDHFQPFQPGRAAAHQLGPAHGCTARVAFARFGPTYRQRTAMNVANNLRTRLRTGDFATGLALVWLWRRGDGVWRTFLAAHLVAAAVYCHLMAPCLPQMRQAIRDNPVFSAGISWEWALTTGSFLLTGMPWLNGNPEMASHPSLQRVWVEFPAAVMLASAISTT